MKTKLPYVTPLPWRDAAQLLPKPYKELVVRLGTLFFHNQTQLFPCKVDVLSSGQKYVSFLAIERSEDENDSSPWSLQRNDFFWGGGADGDSWSFPTMELAIRAANATISRDGYNLDDETFEEVEEAEDEANVIPTLTNVLEEARAAARISEIAIRRACSFSITDGEGYAGMALYQLLEEMILPAAEMARKLSRLSNQTPTEHEAGKVEATLPFHTVSRIPAVPMANGKRDVAAWTKLMEERELAYHIDDDPADIHQGAGPLFTPEEVQRVKSIVSTFTDEERETYFNTITSL